MFANWRGEIVDIYIFKEVLNPFLIGVAIITVIMLSSFLFQLTDLIIVKDVPLPKVLRLLVYKLPEIIVQTFPMAVLFATMSGLGRLNRENEFTALRMGGISLYRLIVPLLIFGIIISGMTYLLNEEIVPRSNHRAQNIIRFSILKEAMPGIEENIFFKGPKGRLFYVEEYREKTSVMNRVVIYNFPTNSQYPEIITAESGRVIKNKWLLQDGIIHRYGKQGHLTLETSFEVMEIGLARDIKKFYGNQKTPSEMSRKELAKEINLFRESGIKVNSLLVDYHLKLATPFIPLIFILIGAPLSLGNKDSRVLNIILTIVIIFLYYFLISLFRSLGRNGVLPPLVVAWSPNIIFAIVGTILLIYREIWQKLLMRFLPGFITLFLTVLLIIVSNTTMGTINQNRVVKAADSEVEYGPNSGQENFVVNNFQIQSDHFQYNGEQLEIEASGEVRGQYGKLHIRTDKIIVKLEKGGEEVYDVKKNLKDIRAKESSLSGCSLEEPHYYFQAQEVTIYPDDHLEAKHVVLWELKGKLPLFYWPYLYISLKDRSQRLVPEVGYNARRGWFAKLTYNYWYDHRLPGEIYADYYNISGPAGGFKQYFLYQPGRKGSVYYYTQENRTSLSGLFEWEGKIEYQDQRGNWQTDTEVEYTSYPDYNWIEGELELTNSQDRQWINFYSEFDSQNYIENDNLDEKEFDFDFDYTKSFVNNWELGLDYNQDYILDPEDGLQTRWGSEGYLVKKSNNYEFEILLERYAPDFTTEEEDEEEQVSFYRWPEVNFEYYLDRDLILHNSFGRYYEDVSDVKGYRFLNEIDYDNWWRLNKKMTFQTRHLLTDKVYQVTNFGQQNYSSLRSNWIEPENGFNQLSYENKYKLRTFLTSDLTWTNSYTYSTFRGATPFEFDQAENEEEVSSKLVYQNGSFRTSLRGGYDIYENEYLTVKIFSSWQVTPLWELEMGTSYDPNYRIYGDLAFTSRYESKKWEVNSSFRFNPNNTFLEQWDNEVIYELNDEWYAAVRNRIDYEDANIEEANVILKKNFHCRQLWFSYDHINREFMVEYHINLLPDHGFKFGSSNEDDFMFDLGVEELLDIKGD